MISNTMIQTRDYDHPLFYYEATTRTKALDLLTQLKRFIYARVIKSPQLQPTRFKGQQMIIPLSSEESRLGQECVSTCRSGWATDSGKNRGSRSCVYCRQEPHTIRICVTGESE